MLQIVEHGMSLMNLLCGFYLTWQTSQSFKQGDMNQPRDTLLIKWFLLYVFIQLETLLYIILEPIPFGWAGLFLSKGYIIMPHGKWHAFIYSQFEKLEMDEATNKFQLYFQMSVKVITLKLLGILETYIDFIRVEDLALVEDSLKRLNEIIVGKKTSINYKKTMSSIHIKSKVRAPTQPKLKALAEVLDDGQFRDYNLVFNPVDSSIEFVDPDTEKLEHRRTLVMMDLNEDKTLKMEYTEAGTNLQIIRLNKTESVQLWIEPVLLALIDAKGH